MKFSEDLALSALNVITAIEPDYIVIQQKKINSAQIIAPDALVNWEIETFSDMTEKHIPLITALKPEVIIIGTGDQHKIPDRTILKALVETGVGFEIMTTAAACRTYNILIAEDRRAVAALVL